MSDTNGRKPVPGHREGPPTSLSTAISDLPGAMREELLRFARTGRTAVSLSDGARAAIARGMADERRSRTTDGEAALSDRSGEGDGPPRAGEVDVTLADSAICALERFDRTRGAEALSVLLRLGEGVFDVFVPFSSRYGAHLRIGSLHLIGVPNRASCSVTVHAVTIEGPTDAPCDLYAVGEDAAATVDRGPTRGGTARNDGR